LSPIRLHGLKKMLRLAVITMFEQKVELIERSGIDVLISIPFTLEFAAISAQSFVRTCWCAESE